MPHDRLADVEEILDGWYERLAFFERRKTKMADAAAQFALEAEIKEAWANIREYEDEYWQLCPTEAIVISEEVAEREIVKVENAVNSLAEIPEYECPPELIALLEDIQAKLTDENNSASGKLKVAIPLIPSIASYEFEMDTNIMSKTWQKLKNIVRR